jgi:hypothetical protein
LVGTWSGYFNQATSEPVRVLFTFSFSAEQIISGAFILNGQRFNYTRAELDPKAWTVTLEAQGKDKAGNMLTYSLVGKFENSVVISEGDEFVYILNGETLKSIVKSIELNRMFISYYSGDEQIGILV